MIFKLLTIGWLFFGMLSGYAADNPIRPALAVESVAIHDAHAYAQLVSSANEHMQSKYGVPLFMRAYVSRSITGELNEAFALSPSLSFTGLLENERHFAYDTEFQTLRAEFARVSSSGYKTYLKAVRFDGTNTPGWLLNTLLSTENEAALLNDIQAWLDSIDLDARPKINVFKVIVGEAQFSHLVSINAASSEELARLLDYMVTEPLLRTSSIKTSPPYEIYKQTIFEELSVE